ncbi:SprT-like domain-containing protein [Sinimarinibacterium flocculans]|uniref:SprT-like domain-containing protein n=1 Tax=Sinimarinibacterium flocculans TaxID=985250 RepID=UPI001474B8AD|nr:SprT-like domain-containing protein [Sinimarinibacterium flocculans]
MPITESDLATLKDEIDRRHFGGALKDVTIRFAMLPVGHFGSYAPRVGVEISSALADAPKELRKTVVHELIHAFLARVKDPSTQRRNDPHGAAFAAQVRRIRSAGEDLRGELAYATCSNSSGAALRRAAACFLERSERRSNPSGRFDHGGRWYPDAAELQECCAAVRAPTRNWPFSLMSHCRTIAHVSRLHGVDTVALRRYLASLGSD